MLNLLFMAANLGIFISALVLVTLWDPIQKLLSMISLFLFSSFIFLIMNFFFLGLTYLIVYIGAIAILFLFVIMMVPLEGHPKGQSLGVEGVAAPQGARGLAPARGVDRGVVRKVAPATFKFSYRAGPYIQIFVLASVLAYSFKLLALENDMIYVYFNVNWTDAVHSYSDIQVLAELLYIKWPMIIVLISYILWLILIGVLWITLA